MSVEERVLKIFKHVLELDGELDTKGLTSDEIADWTSLAHVTLVSVLEGEFDITMDEDDFLAMNSYDKAVEIVRKLASVGLSGGIAVCCGPIATEPERR